MMQATIAYTIHLTSFISPIIVYNTILQYDILTTTLAVVSILQTKFILPT